ncbi:MAG: hypothetical protein ABIR57_10975 [Aeromicrobium sp.]
MESPDPLPALSADDALSLWVGRVARTHALLEYGVDNVHRFLMRRAGHQVDGKSVKGFDQLVTECSNLLRRSDVDQEILTAGDSALRAAKEATDMRNRIVHDMWLPDPLPNDSEPPRWNTFRRSGDLHDSYNSATSQDLEMVIHANTFLLRTRIRVSGLFMALHESRPGSCSREEGSPDEDNMARYVALMTNRFILHPNGDLDVT